MEKYPKNVKAKVFTTYEWTTWYFQILLIQYSISVSIFFQQTCQELIDRRKQLLKFLRQYDYKKFEWILEKLNIEYKGHPE